MYIFCIFACAFINTKVCVILTNENKKKQRYETEFYRTEPRKRKQITFA